MNIETSPPPSNETIVETYDRLAAPYDWMVAPFAAATRRRAIELLNPDAGEEVLELGCGPGHALVPLAREVAPEGAVLGLDAAPAMVERARRRVANSKHSSQVECLLGDARSLPVPDDSVDVVFVEDTLELFSPDEIATVVDECARVLDSDGRLGVVTMERSGLEAHPFVRLYEWLFEHVPGYDRVGCRPIYAREALKDGGFRIEREKRLRRGYVWPVEILIACHR